MSAEAEIDTEHIEDLAVFAAIEVESKDLEPWALLLRQLADSEEVDRETALWLVKLYNAYDDFGSAWHVAMRWRSPAEWAKAPDCDQAADYPCTQERRNLRGGKVLRHLTAYAEALDGRDQQEWLTLPLQADDPEMDFLRLVTHVRTLWGVGRQTAFEWVEFLAKVAEFPVRAPDAMLWESEGPRRSLQRLYGKGEPQSEAWLNFWAIESRDWLASEGVTLSWEDYETVICDFNVMRDGRYYPGRHLAALRGEIEESSARDLLLLHFQEVIPAPWCWIKPGIDKAKLALYRETGHIVDAP
jgi:hypothetical protein